MMVSYMMENYLMVEYNWENKLCLINCMGILNIIHKYFLQKNMRLKLDYEFFYLSKQNFTNLELSGRYFNLSKYF